MLGLEWGQGWGCKSWFSLFFFLGGIFIVSCKEGWGRGGGVSSHSEPSPVLLLLSWLSCFDSFAKPGMGAPASISSQEELGLGLCLGGKLHRTNPAPFFQGLSLLQVWVDGWMDVCTRVCLLGMAATLLPPAKHT